MTNDTEAQTVTILKSKVDLFEGSLKAWKTISITLAVIGVALGLPMRVFESKPLFIAGLCVLLAASGASFHWGALQRTRNNLFGTDNWVGSYLGGSLLILVIFAVGSLAPTQLH